MGYTLPRPSTSVVTRGQRWQGLQGFPAVKSSAVCIMHTDSGGLLLFVCLLWKAYLGSVLILQKAGGYSGCIQDVSLCSRGPLPHYHWNPVLCLWVCISDYQLLCQFYSLSSKLCFTCDIQRLNDFSITMLISNLCLSVMTQLFLQWNLIY